MTTEQQKLINRYHQNRRRQLKKPSKSFEYICRGGPYDGHTIWLSGESTLIFKVRNYKGYYCARGRYNKSVQWNSIQ